jgi:hypothetical protein
MSRRKLRSINYSTHAGAVYWTAHEILGIVRFNGSEVVSADGPGGNVYFAYMTVVANWLLWDGKSDWAWRIIDGPLGYELPIGCRPDGKRKVGYHTRIEMEKRIKEYLEKSEL